MSHRAIRIIWGIPPPNGPKRNIWRQAAIMTALDQSPNVCEVLIRAGIHSTTIKLTAAGPRPVPDDPHVTVSFKTAEMIAKRTHITAHGYTTGESSGIQRVTPAEGGELPDVGRDGRPIWPTDYDIYSLETVDSATTLMQQIPPPNQNESFLTYPAPETVHGHTPGGSRKRKATGAKKRKGGKAQKRGSGPQQSRCVVM